jgi:hypothetical protein
MAKTIYVSDFDETLATTGAVVHVTDVSGEKRTMSAAEYAVYEPQEGDVFDHSEFDDLIDPRPIPRYVRLLRKAAQSDRVDKVAILTARAKVEPVARFLRMVGMPGDIKIVALGTSDPERKKAYLRKQIEQGYTRMAFVDDSPKNVEVARELSDEYPNARILAHHVKPPEHQVDEPIISKKSRDPNARVKNPITGRDILVKTALDYPPDHPARRAAIKQLTEVKCT